MDFNNFLKELPDPFGEIPSFSRFMQLLNEIWTQRLNLIEIMFNLDQEENMDPVCDL
jgi:hypothetical protein